MIKKMIALHLALMVCLSLAACGGGSETSKQDATELPATTEASTEPQMTKEEMLAVAQDIGEDFDKDFQANPVSAEAKYLGNIYYVTGIVNNIESDRVGVGSFTVHLPKEEIMTLTKGQWITIVGKIDSVEKKPDVYYPDIYFWYGTMINAYFVTDRFTVEGYLDDKNASYAPAWNFFLPDDNYAKLVYFENDEEVAKMIEDLGYSTYYKITIEAQFDGSYKNAVIIGEPVKAAWLGQ